VLQVGSGIFYDTLTQFGDNNRPKPNDIGVSYMAPSGKPPTIYLLSQKSCDTCVSRISAAVCTRLCFFPHRRMCPIKGLQHNPHRWQFVTLMTSDSSRRTFTRIALFQYQLLNERCSHISYQKFLAIMLSTFRKIDETESTLWNACNIPGFKVSVNYSNSMKVPDQLIKVRSAEKYC
jgi:hypothetical protein